MNKMKEQMQHVVFGKFREAGMLLAIVLLSVLVQSRNKMFFTYENIEDLLANTSILAVLAVGMMMVIISGGIDLSIGSVIALSGMSVTKLMIAYPNIPTPVAVLLGMLIGVVCGTITGFLVAWGKVPPIIASLGMMNVYRGLTYIVSDGLWVSAHQMTPGFKALSTGSFLYIRNFVWIVLITYLIAYVFLEYTQTGRRIYAVGSSAESAVISGIKKGKTLVQTYAAMGMLAGLAGIMWVSKFASAQGNTALGYEMSVIAACVLGGVSVSGGVGKLGGVILGVMFYGILSNSLPMLNVSPFYQQLIQAVLILAAILLNVILKRKVNERNRKAREIS